MTKLQHNRRSRVSARGFTLIELLVVIAIIGVLAAILFPVFARAREKAKAATCQSNLKQLCMALIMYADDADGAGPFSTCGSFWEAKLGDGGYAAKLVTNAATGAWSPLYSCPTGGAYGANNYRGSHGPAGACNGAAPWRLADARQPERTLLVGDSIGVLAQMPVNFYDVNGDGLLTPRHQAVNTVGFCDGHVKGLAPTWLKTHEGDDPWFWWGIQ
jgi:prepilin-type N-terminal cleavage/methylation domain-containing protein/prepilin-type processing-associated H-X9-DG protein